MRYLTTILFFFLTLIAKGQSFDTLTEIKGNDAIATGKAIIYGNFIQRLGFSSGGFPQDITIINLETKQIFAFRVKPTFKTAKENTFACSIEPGKYALLNYYWTKSTWYGAKVFTEPIFKNVDVTDNFEQKIKSGQLNQNELEQFTFEIKENSLNYLGSWHFDKGLISFTDDKIKFDNAVKGKFDKLDFATAITVIPN